jgi:hypothetical protein
MTRRHIPREDLPKTRTERRAASKPIGLGEIRKSTSWVWLYCRACGRGVPAALAPRAARSEWTTRGSNAFRCGLTSLGSILRAAGGGHAEISGFKLNESVAPPL